MHMADALLSPAVGIGFMAASGAALAYSAKKLTEEADEKKAPLMGVMGAFVFAAQMINFTIPGTGSSGHLGGGLLLAFLLGPYAAFITIASVLIVQALFFADGGILALGTNIWNLGFYPALVWIVISRVMAGKGPGPGRVAVSAAAIIGAVMALELGALSVAVETVLSGRTELPFGRFALVMAAIHLPIGLVEGVVTAAVLNLVFRLRPEIVMAGLGAGPEKTAGSHRPVLVTMAVAALVLGGVVAWFASAHPDGLEWTIRKITGQEELKTDSGLAEALGKVQEKTALMPGYDFKKDEAESGKDGAAEAGDGRASVVSPGSSVSGVVGSVIVLALVGAVGLGLYKLRGPREKTG